MTASPSIAVTLHEGPMLGGSVLASASGRLTDGRRVELALTCEGLTLIALSDGTRPARTVCVILTELVGAACDAIERDTP